MERMETRRSSLNITHHIHLCKTKQDVCVNQLLLLLSTFIYSAVPRYLLSLHPAVVGVPGCDVTNSWMVSKEVDESLETSGLLRCTLAPQAVATFSISVWSVDTHMLEKQNCTVVIVVCNAVLLVTWLFLLHICRYYTWVCQWQNEALIKRGKQHSGCADLHPAVNSTHIHSQRKTGYLTVDCVIIKAPGLWKIKAPLESGTSPTFNELFCGQLSTFPFHPFKKKLKNSFFLNPATLPPWRRQ